MSSNKIADIPLQDETTVIVEDRIPIIFSGRDEKIRSRVPMSEAVAEEEEENFTLSPIDITSTEQLLITDQLKLYDMNLPPPEDLVIDDPSMSKIKYDNNSIAFGSYLTGIILLLTLLIFGFAIFGSFCWQNYLQIRDRENRNDNGRDDRFEYDENEVVDLEEGRTKNL